MYIYIYTRFLYISAPDLLILLSQKHSIVQLSAGTETDSSPDVPLALPPHILRGIRAFDFNPSDENIYWADGKTKTIRKMKSDGTNVNILQLSTQSKILLRITYINCMYG